MNKLFGKKDICGAVNPHNSADVCPLPAGHVGDHIVGASQWSGFTNPDVQGFTPPSSGICLHVNKHYNTGANATRAQVDVICQLGAGHPGDHYALVDVRGEPVLNGYWGDMAGYPAGTV